jgi:hypothetical protein
MMQLDDIVHNNGKTDMIIREGRYYGYYVYGMQRTGTTLVERVIADNWKILMSNNLRMRDLPGVRPPSLDLDWKHHISIPHNLPENAPVVMIYKNPYTWIESMLYRKGVANGGWSQTHGETFNRRDQAYRKDDPQNGTTYTDNLLASYKAWFNTWLPYHDMNKDTSVIIKYEELLDPNKRMEIFCGIADKFGWPEFEFPQLTWANHVGSSQPFTKTKQEYYLTGRPEQLNEMEVQLVNTIIGTDLIEKLGYNVL